MKKRNIGCIVENTEGNYSRNLWTIFRETAESADCNLRVFEGRRLNDKGNDNRHNAIYSLAEKYRPDGWLIAGTQIVSYVTLEEYADFVSRFGPDIPIVSFGIELPGVSSVLLDNGQGLRRLMEHLIRTHGYRRIAFIKGPEGNFEALDRYKVFLSTMAAHRIPVDPDLVLDGNFNPIDGYEACKKLHESGATCDCIVCANDDTALGAYYFIRELKRKGIRPPTEHITGFDNARNIRTQRPALTTVAQPLERMVERAFRILLGALPGERPQERAVFPSELIVRESCGCHFMSEPENPDDLYVRPARTFRIHQSMQTYSLADLFDELTHMLPSMGMRACFIVQYGASIGSSAPGNVPEESTLLFAYAGGRRLQQTENTVFPTADLLPEPFLSYPHRVTDLIKPLFFRDEQYGYIIFEAIDNDTRQFEEFRGQIADSLQFALMMNRQKAIESDLARSVEELRETNQLIEKTSVTDALTGFLNRRGVLKYAGRYLDSTDADGGTDLLIYVDIDRLKIINRKQGYPEGDKAIKATADILAAVFSEDDILGRFCGDEFVVLVKNASESRFESYRQQIVERLEAYRHATGSGLELYLGHTVAVHGQDIQPERVIRQADTDLYIRKRHATNNAVK